MNTPLTCTYKSVVIFFFSGTGNSHAVATWFAEQATLFNCDCKVFDIAKTSAHSITDHIANALVFIVSPTHGFNFPKITLDFIHRLPQGGNSVVLVNTRAGFLIGHLLIPGLSGVALWLSAFLLKYKGYQVMGLISFDMPSNWISIHPALRENSIRTIFAKNQKRVALHAQKLFSGHKDFSSCKNLIQDILISPIALGYFLIGRFTIAKTFYASSTCNHCGLCSKNCPVQAIKCKDGRPFWTLQCESCMKCMNECPHQSIETAHGLILATSLLTSIGITFLATLFFKIPAYWQNLHFAIWSLSFLLLLILLYNVQHFALRFRFAARLIQWTSLTHFKGWGRYLAKRMSR